MKKDFTRKIKFDKCFHRLNTNKDNLKAINEIYLPLKISILKLKSKKLWKGY
jgi:hypothetical protein